MNRFENSEIRKDGEYVCIILKDGKPVKSLTEVLTDDAQRRIDGRMEVISQTSVWVRAHSGVKVNLAERHHNGKPIVIAEALVSACGAKRNFAGESAINDSVARFFHGYQFMPYPEFLKATGDGEYQNGH